LSKKLFEDLGFRSDDASELALRSEIAARLSLLIEERNLKQKEAANLFKIPQPTVSKIINGNIDKLSLAFFVRLLVRADIPFAICRGKASPEIEVELEHVDESLPTFYSEVRSASVGYAVSTVDATEAYDD
jgi:predicted XRE-type DNA-binding protein